MALRGAYNMQQLCVLRRDLVEQLEGLSEGNWP